MSVIPLSARAALAPLECVRERLEQHDCHPRGDQERFEARCPAHDDRAPSLSVAVGADGRVLLHCHAGCSADAIVDALGLRMADLYPVEEPNNGRKQIVATYRYADEHDELLFEVVRFAPKDFRQRRPDGKGGWLWRLDGTRRVLYRLPSVLAAVEADERVWIAEGEKDADALARAGVVATCNPGGAGKWRSEFGKPLHGARVVIVADRDERGRDHARQVARSLESIAAAVQIVEAAAGKDAADHLAAGRGLDDFAPAQNTAAGTDDPPSEPPDPSEPRTLSIASLEKFVAVEERGASPLVGSGDDVLIAEGGDALVYGDGGAGKTTLTIDLAFHLAAGDAWLGVPVARPVRVLLIEAEGPRPLFRRKLKRKLNGWTGSPVQGHLAIFDEPWASEFTFTDAAWRAALAERVREGEFDVLVAGPVTRLGMDAAGTLQEVRDFLRLVDDVRRQSGRHVAVLLVHHENKGGSVSGAWEGSGDTLLHIEARGPGHTRLHVQKARWSSTHHGQTLELTWTDSEGFEVEVTERDYHDQIAELLADGKWRTAREIAAKRDASQPGIGASETTVKKKLADRPDLYAQRSGAEVGRSNRATVYQLLHSAENGVSGVGALFDPTGTTPPTPTPPKGVGSSGVESRPPAQLHSPSNAVHSEGTQ